MYGVLEAGKESIEIYSIDIKDGKRHIGSAHYHEIDNLGKIVDDMGIRFIGIVSYPSHIFIWNGEGEIIKYIDVIDIWEKTIGRGGRSVSIPFLPRYTHNLVTGNILDTLINEIHNYKDEAYFGPPSTYLIHLLTGKYVIDVTTGVSLGFYDSERVRPSKIFSKFIKYIAEEPRVIDNVEYIGMLGNAEISIVMNKYMAEVLGFGCLRNGCTSMIGDKVIYMMMVVDKKAYGKNISPALVLKVGDYKVYGIEGYVYGSVLLWRRECNISRDWDIDIDNVSKLIIDLDRRGSNWVLDNYDFEEILNAIVFKTQRLFREFIRVSGYRPDVIYVSGLHDRLWNLLHRIADLTGYYLAVSRENMFIDGVYSLLKIYGGRGKFDDIREAEDKLTLIEPRLGEKKRLEIINSILDRMGR